MMQQRSETDDDARQREKAKARKERGTKGREKEGEGEEGQKKNREEGEVEAARGKGKDDSLVSTTLPLGDCGTSRPELETNEPVLQVSVWNGNGVVRAWSCVMVIVREVACVEGNV